MATDRDIFAQVFSGITGIDVTLAENS